MEQSDAGPVDIPPIGAATSEVMTSGVWPPPATGRPPVIAVIAPVFSPVRRLSWVILVFLGLYAATAVLGVGGALLPPPPGAGNLEGRQIAYSFLAMIQGLLLLGMGGCFLVWTYRLNKNLGAFDVAGVRNTPAWAVAYFFIPILSLYRPYQVFREIWQASDPGPAARTGQAWRNTQSPALLGFWWVSVILMNFVVALSSNSGGDASIDVVDNAVGLLSTLLALQVVRLVTARQEKAARLLSLIA